MVLMLLLLWKFDVRLFIRYKTGVKPNKHVSNYVQAKAILQSMSVRPSARSMSNGYVSAPGVITPLRSTAVVVVVLIVALILVRS